MVKTRFYIIVAVIFLAIVAVVYLIMPREAAPIVTPVELPPAEPDYPIPIINNTTNDTTTFNLTNDTAVVEPPVVSSINLSSPLYTADYWLTHPFRGAVVELGYDDNDPDAYPTATSFKQLRSLGANIVVLETQYLWTMEPPYERDEEQFRILESALDNAKEANLSVVVAVRNGPGRSDMFAGLEDSAAVLSVYHDEDVQEAWFDMLADMVAYFGNRPEIIAWEPMVEPTPDTYFNDAEQGFKNSGPAWNSLAAKSIDRIRKTGDRRPIVVEPVNWGAYSAISVLSRFADDNIIYSIHFYEPFDYTHQEGPDYEWDYPGNVGEIDYDEDTFTEMLKPVYDFGRLGGAPVFVGEYGGMRFVPYMEDYIDDVVSVFEQYGFSHAYYNWGKDPGWDIDAFNLHYGSNASSHSLDVGSPLFRPILDSWMKNPEGHRMTPLNGVKTFAYVIDETENNINEMAQSDYDMLIIDEVRSLSDMADYNMAKQVRKLKSSGNPAGADKILLAYISIGEAEDYRWYWEGNWRVGNPKWIEAEDPDGWDGNYPLQFWDPKWRSIIFNYIDMVIDDGFDGVYLDWVEAYEVSSVSSAADFQKKNAKNEMKKFVCEISKYVRQEGKLIVAQNGLDLGSSADYLSCIDGVAQEAVWYDWEGDPDFTGEEGDVKVSAYDSSEYIKKLKVFKDAGLPVFTVDYAEDPHNANEAYFNARGQGFIEYVTMMSLDALSSTPPEF